MTDIDVRKRAADYTVHLFHTRDDETGRCRWCAKQWPCPRLRQVEDRQP